MELSPVEGDEALLLMTHLSGRGYPKVFCIGFNKTGTTTLHRILQDQLSYRSAHKPRWTDWSITRNRPELDQFDAFSDGGCASIKNLDELYPEAIFVLNTRPLRHWVLSRYKAVERSAISTLAHAGSPHTRFLRTG